MRPEELAEARRQVKAMSDIAGERDRQERLFGVQKHHPAYWLALLGKQLGQLGEATVKREWASKGGPGSPYDVANQKIRNEAVQLAAVALNMIECIDRGDMPDTLTTSQPSDPRQKAKALGVGDEQINYAKDEYL